jgi:ubiquinone/menaquinone biosynthesis C-methylase UbiE
LWIPEPLEKFDPIQYKIKTRTNWNTVARKYHMNWASNDIGPFRSTVEITKIADIKSNDIVLELGCGTGAGSKKILEKLGKEGRLIAIDLSRGALNIAKKENRKSNVDFLEMDLERVAFSINFTKVFCQFVLMFLPSPELSLKTINGLMTKKGKILISVHGKPEEVPYFSCIMESIVRFFPNILPLGSHSVHALGDREKLKNILERTGFKTVHIYEYDFTYATLSFEDYWSNYMRVTANSIRQILQKDYNLFLQIKENAQKNSRKFLKGGNLIFPWKVLIASAEK